MPSSHIPSTKRGHPALIRRGSHHCISISPDTLTIIHIRRAARGAHFRRRVQPCPTGLASVALLISAPSRLRVSRSDGRGDAKHAEGCRTRRLLSMACSTLFNKTNLCENCYNAQSPSARRLVWDSGFIAVLIEVEPPRITAVTIALPAQRPPCMSVGKRRHPPSSPSSGVTRGSAG